MRYLIQKSETDPLWWVVTDTEAQVVCRFKEGEFNDTQQFTVLNDIHSKDEALKLAGVVKGIADWMRENHYELIFSSPTKITEAARKEIGELLRNAREDEGWTLRHLAQLTGIAFNHIGRIEQGKYNVTVDTLARLCAALGMRITIE